MAMLINVLVNLLIFGIICAVVDYIVGQIDFFSPFRKIVRMILAVIALIWLLGILTGNIHGFTVWS